MGFMDSLGLGDIDLGIGSGTGIGGFLASTGKFLGLLLLLIIVGAVATFFLYKRKEKELYKNTIHFFEEVNRQLIPLKDVKAAELTVPNTNIKVFYIKSEDLYLPRGTKKMGKNHYWYAIRNNRELVNFILTNINEEMKAAGIDYDHTDMRYAHTNLREIIKRNYKDKSVKWWKEYKDAIVTIVYIFVFSLGFFFLISQIGKLIGQIGPLMDKSNEILSSLAKFDYSCSGARAATGGVI